MPGKRLPVFSSAFFLKSIFALSLFILVFISGLAYKHSVSLGKSSELVMHTLKVNVQLEQLFSNVKDSETAQRGYIITQDTTFLQAYSDARVAVNNSFIYLKRLTNDDPQHQVNLDSLFSLINERYTYVEVTLKIAGEEPIHRELLNTSVLIGKGIMDKIRIHINMMKDLELKYLEERQLKYENIVSFTPLITLFLLLFALLIFIFSFIKINRDLYTMEQKNERLRILTEAMTQAEEIGAFSSWQWNLNTGKRYYSDNQYSLLGVPPQSFEPSLDNFLTFVHSRDHHIIIESDEKAKNEHVYPPIFFRVIRKDGELRYFKSMSKVITDAQGHKLLIGINADITEQHMNMLDLEDRNKELQVSNKELASFNYVASHDLQEPLRKVQTYISRFTEEDLLAMSDKGKEYFAKIRMAVTRMRVLIDALLLFSRTNKTDKKFEETDLNQVLENTKQDIAHLIEKSNATIIETDLPHLMVIPFQIQQLFTNLIVNAIKYSKDHVPPVITITCDTLMAKEFLPAKPDSTKRFCKISFEDNGIGFDQQYAETIFTLFQRLHHDSAYEGTGIGLSICKKIAENHKGYIFAEGTPGVGATFCVYLPA